MSTRNAHPPVPRAPIARAIGAVLGAAFAVVRKMRRPRPIHPRGVVLRGEIRWLPQREPSGLSFVDDAPAQPVRVVARVSRSLGLPAPLPDIIGLAVRFDARAWAPADDADADPAEEPGAADGIPADIEFASTGWGVPGRFALLPHRRAERARLGVLFPYRGRRGPVLLGARTRSGRPAATDPRELGQVSDAGWTLTLGHAAPLGRWHPFAVLELHLDPDQSDTGLRFDAVRRPIPGARTYAWVRAARQPSYARTQPADAALRMPWPTTATHA